ncbi:hypothetical protein DPX16_21826 [Anabarilius grahami]|uniref:Uncharacterized protein n=1 Tax=Anabarilius grahami TaxID=495550 RepID=A0A3N0YQS9_ANAGA|nr:hypothetical protein DPX16_21826 [Anabarilius grahami]
MRTDILEIEEFGDTDDKFRYLIQNGSLDGEIIKNLYRIRANFVDPREPSVKMAAATPEPSVKMAAAESEPSAKTAATTPMNPGRLPSPSRVPSPGAAPLPVPSPESRGGSPPRPESRGGSPSQL